MITLADAPLAPAGLLYLATFSKQERAEIAASPRLIAAIRAGEPAEWTAIMRQDGAARSVAALARVARLPVDDDGMRCQAADDLKRTADVLAALTDNRRGRLYATACSLAKYSAHRILSEEEIYAGLREAAAANGSLTLYGRRWVDGTIRRGLMAGRNDMLPPLSSRFRSNGGGS